MRRLKSAHFSASPPVLLVGEEGVFHLLSYFLWDHQVFLKKPNKEMISCVWESVRKKVGLPVFESRELVQAKPHPAWLS